MKGVIKLGKKRKLNPCYVHAYETFSRVGKVAYELKLPSEIASFHLVIHDSILKKGIGDPESNLPMGGLGVDENLFMKRVRLKSLIDK